MCALHWHGVSLKKQIEAATSSLYTGEHYDIQMFVCSAVYRCCLISSSLSSERYTFTLLAEARARVNGPMGRAQCAYERCCILYFNLEFTYFRYFVNYNNAFFVENATEKSPAKVATKSEGVAPQCRVPPTNGGWRVLTLSPDWHPGYTNVRKMTKMVLAMARMGCHSQYSYLECLLW